MAELKAPAPAFVKHFTDQHSLNRRPRPQTGNSEARQHEPDPLPQMT
jgi:hypothetical protein